MAEARTGAMACKALWNSVARCELLVGAFAMGLAWSQDGHVVHLLPAYIYEAWSLGLSDQVGILEARAGR